MLYLQEVYPKVQLPYKRNYAYISVNYNIQQQIYHAQKQTKDGPRLTGDRIYGKTWRGSKCLYSPHSLYLVK